MKPLTVAREEFANALVELCNNAQLPFFVIESILKDVLQEVHAASVKQYEAEKAEYEKEAGAEEEK
jgi:hypothetical protein